jgi:hypothetical protein
MIYLELSFLKFILLYDFVKIQIVYMLYTFFYFLLISINITNSFQKIIYVCKSNNNYKYIYIN